MRISQNLEFLNSDILYFLNSNFPDWLIFEFHNIIISYHFERFCSSVEFVMCAIEAFGAAGFHSNKMLHHLTSLISHSSLTEGVQSSQLSSAVTLGWTLTDVIKNTYSHFLILCLMFLSLFSVLVIALRQAGVVSKQTWLTKMDFG